jgi:hypothetical protein
MSSNRYIDGERLLAEAEAIAAADDWGDDGFREAYDTFVAALNAEAELTPQGVERTRSHVKKLLVGRLRLFRDRKAHPDIAREQIRAPIFVTGIGRSGTSYYNALLASDERNYSPPHWQVWSLSPPPHMPGADVAPAIAACEHYIAFEGWQDPEVRKTHNYTAANAAEDLLIHDYTFRTGAFAFFWNVPSYAAWQSRQDAAPVYRFEHKALQALQYGGARDRWVLKSPIHLFALDQLFAQFPDARIAVNHRDPVKCLASMSSMLAAHRQQFGNAPAPVDREVSLASMEGMAWMMEGMIERRKDPAVDQRFCDIDFLALEADPLGQVGKLYDQFGIEFTDAARQAMARHVAENRKGKFGAHRYDISETGLRREEVRERFKFYTDYFDIPYED